MTPSFLNWDTKLLVKLVTFLSQERCLYYGLVHQNIIIYLWIPLVSVFLYSSFTFSSWLLSFLALRWVFFFFDTLNILGHFFTANSILVPSSKSLWRFCSSVQILNRTWEVTWVSPSSQNCLFHRRNLMEKQGEIKLGIGLLVYGGAHSVLHLPWDFPWVKLNNTVPSAHCSTISVDR